jgi:Cytochrome c7 and related cytochrome c
MAGLKPGARLFAKAAAIGAILMVMAGVGWWWGEARTDYQTSIGWPLPQPVPFSHEHHAGGLGIDCRFCHSGVEKSANAGLPPTYTCMTCHSQVWTNADILKPVRDSLANRTPIVWNRVTNLPDYVYFNHSIHIAKGVGCASCHGEVDRMPLMAKAHSFSMQFCLDCHRDPGPNLRPKEAVFDMHWQRDEHTPSPQQLLDFYHVGNRRLTDCTICHR